MTSQKKKIMLEVTEDQLDILEGIYTASGWDFNPVTLTSQQNGKLKEHSISFP